MLQLSLLISSWGTQQNDFPTAEPIIEEGERPFDIFVCLLLFFLLCGVVSEVHTAPDLRGSNNDAGCTSYLSQCSDQSDHTSSRKEELTLVYIS